MAVPELVGRTRATVKREDGNEITEREVTGLLADFAAVWAELFPTDQAPGRPACVQRAVTVSNWSQRHATGPCPPRTEAMVRQIGAPMRCLERMLPYVRAEGGSCCWSWMTGSARSTCVKPLAPNVIPPF